ncbi:MAG: Na/Pi symporter [Halanaerobium sp.]|nr:Na/Pi symporter [Halanaerobium sp.]
MELLIFFAGFAVFLAGLLGFERTISYLAGPGLERYLGYLTGNLFTAFCFGLLITALVQSSSLVLVTLVGLARARLMNLRQALGVILGANLGTTVTIHIFSLNLEGHYYLFFLLALVLFFFSPGRKPNVSARAFFYLGLCFAGFFLLKQSSGFLQNFMATRFHGFVIGPLGGLASGIILTGLVQSSSVVSGFIVLMVYQGVFTLPETIPMIMGSNIGTCSTAILASAIAGREGQKIALAHLVFNLCGVLFWLPFRQIFVYLVLIFSSLPARQVAFFHTLFNLLTVLAFLPFASLLVEVLDHLFHETGGK